MGRVKGALKVRFADITDRFFDKVTPYVFWARGDLQQASALFTKLIDGEKRSRYRAMYMTEIARMHAQLGQPDLACRFYRMASDIALEKGKAMINAQEVTGQQLMLLASVYDQGMMTANNNRSAADHWKYVVTSKTFNQGAANMAVISMLCFHSRPGNGTEPSSFVEAKRRLETMVDKNPKYQYYLSMLQALTGQGSDADNTYRAFLQRENADGTQDSPGRRMVSSPQTSGVSRKQKNNVWHALSTMITRSGLPQPLHVLWRSHLQPLRVCDPTRLIPPSEADLCCDNLDLRLNSEGYLTGNMKTLLPPMRSINLDPYTGKLCFPQIPGRTEPWTSLDRFCSSSLMFDSFDNGCIPCPVEVYRDKDGTTIQMMLPTSLKNFGNSNWTKSNQAALTFFWSNGKGESAKLNVLKMFWQLIYEKRKQQIMREALKDKKSEQWKKDRLKLLKHCLDTKREMDYYWIDDTMYAFAEEREKNPKTSLRKFLNDSNHVSPELSWNKNYTSYGKTLALSFIFESELFAMFIDCSSREGFLQPKFKMEYHISHFGDIPNCRNYKLAKSEIFYYSKSTKVGPCLLVCGQKGKVLAKIKQEEDENETVPHIIGCDSLVKVTSNNRLWCWNDQNIKIDESLPPVTIVTSLECSVVVVSLRDQEYIRFVDIPSLESVSIKSVCDKKGLQISEDNLQIKASTVKVLTSCYRTGSDHSYQEVILGLDMNLVTLQIIQDPARSVEVIMTEVLPISGFPVEHKFVGERDGYLLSWTQMDESSNEYKEHLSYFSRDSELLGVLPCLGRGPRSFYLVYLLGDADTQKDYPGYGLPGWYVYMRDGYDGIIALKLPTCVRTS
ncbi:uncharacterized protein LOC132565279 [Ylistrum balloti]|uniref:uncharacterized protein LOC132565279 n=1 Tax=Ylistrum balloti TaxID=509963 RepID=UPI002905818C|nr:uncharacterized protein LOC132565279 [Ylistrum balloti]